MDLTQFFEQEHQVKPNYEAQKMPAEFADWENNEDICRQYFMWIRHESKCASLKLDINTDVSGIKEELAKQSFMAVPHRDGDSDGWKSIVLHGHASCMSDSTDFYRERGIIGEDDLPKWTDVSKFFPKTVAWIKENIPFKSFDRARIMIVEPGGYVNPHKDYPRGQMLGGFNVAVIHPEGAEMAIDNGGIVPWVEGESRLIDIGRLHSVRNTSSVERIHLIFHHYPIADWDMGTMKLVCRSYTMYQTTL